MPHDLPLIFTLAGALCAAVVLGLITQWLRLSPIVGYLLAGIVVGPFTPGFVANRGLAEQLAEFGVILLMFGVGLQFHVKELLSVRRVAIPGAIAQIVVATTLCVLLARAFDWSYRAGIVFGLSVAVASTVVLTRVLTDHRALHTRTGHIAVGWLVVEDIFTVFVLVMLPAVVGGGAGADMGSLVAAVGAATLKLALLVGLTVLLGRKVIPALLAVVARTRSRELFTLSVLVIALGIAVGSAQWFGASMALGAFLAGMIVGQSEFASRAAADALPLRDAFAVLFFVSTGMLFDPGELIAAPGLPAATLAVVVIGKPAAALAVVLLLGYELRVALSVAVALAQIGEFSFILASLGQKLGVLPGAASQALVAVSIVSITINPLLYRGAERAARWLATRRGASEARLSPPLREGALNPSQRSAHRAVVVGCGPVGKVLAQLLRENGIEPTFIELNHETVSRLRADGMTAVYGDASQREILALAGVEHADSLIFSADGAAGDAAIREARELNPDINIMARVAYASEVPPLERAGASVVVASEVEAALAMAEHVLRQLGATGEQLDRVRHEVRTELA